MTELIYKYTHLDLYICFLQNIITYTERVIKKNLKKINRSGHDRSHVLGWKTLTLPKRIGDLGMRNLGTVNKACIMKLG